MAGTGVADPKSVAVAFNDCINRRDLDSLATLMTDDHTFIDTADGVVAGKRACLDAWRGFESFPDYRNVFESFAVRGGLVTIVGGVTAMADPGFEAQPANGPPNPPVAPPRKARSGGRTVVVVLLLIFGVCVAADSFGAWFWWSRTSDGANTDGSVGQCFPAGPDGPLDTSHGKVSCSHPNAIWQITKVLDGRHDGDVIGTCGPDGDALIYIAEEDRSYCLDYIN